MRLDDDRVEELEAVVDVDAHGVAQPQGQDIDHRALVVDVLLHAGGVLAQTLRVDEAVEHRLHRKEGDRDVVGVAAHFDVFDCTFIF